MHVLTPQPANPPPLVAVAASDSPEVHWLGEVVFDRGRERDGFEVPVANHAPESRTCRRAAPWIAPRADLLGPRG
jgi:hypothetical protein